MFDTGEGVELREKSLTQVLNCIGGTPILVSEAKSSKETKWYLTSLARTQVE